MQDDYREGNDPTESVSSDEDGESNEKENTESTKEEANTPKESRDSVPIPISAFVVVKYEDGRIDVIPEFPGLKTQRKSSVLEIRDMARAVSETLQAQLTSELVLSKITESMRKARTSVVSPTQAATAAIRNQGRRVR